MVKAIVIIMWIGNNFSRVCVCLSVQAITFELYKKLAKFQSAVKVKLSIKIIGSR